MNEQNGSDKNKYILKKYTFAAFYPYIQNKKKNIFVIKKQKRQMCIHQVLSDYKKKIEVYGSVDIARNGS
ncbi:MAG: hypothetical protein JNM36_12015 [Chitinophagales bacterium]|nr:hypothetical protein [Chitinophagales bacterium]